MKGGDGFFHTNILQDWDCYEKGGDGCMDFFTQRFYDRSYATASMHSFLEIEKKQWHTCSQG